MEYYRLGTKEAFSELKSGPSGLSDSEARARQEKYGMNTVQIEKKLSFFRLFASQFRSYLPWLLVFVAAVALIAGIYLGREEQTIDGIVISFIVLVNAFVGAYQDYKSEKSARLLKSMLKTEAVVLRGRKLTVDASELVPGDVIFLKEGDKVPADCRIIECNELKIDESMLTGESEHVLKKVAAIGKSAPLAERRNMAFMNTFVATGQATCLVVATGRDTEIGKIARSLSTQHESLFIKEVDEASKKITYVALSLILVALAIFYYHDQHILSLFMLGSALIIGSIPEGLPAIVTFSLAMGSSKLAKENVLVKRKTLLETLGSVDAICTDKTGTLTENRMSVSRLYFDGNVTTLGAMSKRTSEEFMRCSLLCNEAKDTDKGFVGDALDIALIDFFNEAGSDIIELRKKFPAERMEPFSSAKKYARSHNRIGARVVAYSKGAPEVILDRCGKMMKDGKAVRISGKDRNSIMSALKGFSEKSLRNIAFSSDDVFLGFVGVYDPPKKGIREVVNTVYDAGIELKMITGDNVHTAEAIARECGFRNINTISWEEFKDLSREELMKSVERCNVFARTSPEDKLKIVAALQENGRRVAITGDGVNDVPALKKADVGVAMGKRGSDIAKEAADLIILDDDLRSIVAGIREGRTIFSNIRKVINYLLTANLAEVLVVFVSSLMGLIPFLAIQLLWVNFVTDIAPAMALGIDPPHKDIMGKRPTGRKEKLINKRITFLTVGISVKKVVMMFIIFLATYQITSDLILAQTMTFTWLVLSHFIRVAAIRFDEGVGMFVNKYLNWSILIPLLLQLVILYTPLAGLFHAVPLTAFEWAVIAASFVAAIGLAKVITYVIDRNLPRSERDY